MQLQNWKNFIYPTNQSGVRPRLHGPDLPIPLNFSANSELHLYNRKNKDLVSIKKSRNRYWARKVYINWIKWPGTRSKDSAYLLCLKLKKKNTPTSGTASTRCRNREKEFTAFFSEESLEFCKDILGLIMQLSFTVYDPSQWRLYIDSCKENLEGILLNNGNILPSVPIAYSVYLKISYENLSFLLNIRNTTGKFASVPRILTMILRQQSV